MNTNCTNCRKPPREATANAKDGEEKYIDEQIGATRRALRHAVEDEGVSPRGHNERKQIAAVGFSARNTFACKSQRRN